MGKNSFMKLKISEIENKGVAENERIILKVLESDNVGQYVIFKTKKLADDRVSSRPSDVFWFQNKEVKKGDWVVIYTKSGTYKSIINEKGNTSHFFYWDKKEPLWKDSIDIPILLHIDEWDL